MSRWPTPLSGLRPAPLPASVGLGYWHVAYRLHVRAAMENGGALEGLYFVCSDCDRRIVALAGDWLTDFRFHFSNVSIEASDAAVRGKIISPDASAEFHIDRKTAPKLTEGSPFSSLDQATRALEYKPAALSPGGPDSIRVVEVRRDPSAWKWRPVAVAGARWQFLAGYDAPLEVCYEVGPIDYLWERPRSVRVKPCAS